jgi:processing peptidase subunit beta
MAWNQAPALVSTLPNGIKVATKETFSELSTVGVFVEAGVRNETPELAGVSYLIEKLALSGTTKRPAAKLAAEVESLGATMDVDVGREQSSYTITTGSKDMKQGFDILADVVTDPAIGSLEKQKEGILRALADEDAPTRSVIEDRLHTCAFRDYSLGHSCIGPFDGIETLTQTHLKGYMDENYTGNNLVIAASGAVKHEEVVALATSAFGGLKEGSTTGTTKPYFCGAELIYRNDEMGPTAYIAVGWEGVPWKSPDAVTFMVMAKIIGSYKKNSGLVPGTISGNRVINAVANKMQVGCADEFECFNINYKDTGMFGFYIVCDEVAVEHAIGELMFGCNLLSFSVTDEEVERGKRELKASLISGSGSTAETCADLGTQMLGYGRSIPIAEMFLRIDAVDSEEVKRVAWQYLNDGEVATTALGPLHGMPQYYDLRRMTGMHRY